MLNENKRVALIFGVTGQDGAYLSEWLTSLGYDVHGVSRSGVATPAPNVGQAGDPPRISFHFGDLLNRRRIAEIIETVRPHEIYNLAAQSRVNSSFENPIETAEVNGLGPLIVLEAIRDQGTNAQIRFFQASTSELYGSGSVAPQNELTAFRPGSPYAFAKLMAHWATINYREAFGLHASAGILFNHESPRRSQNFVTRHVTRSVAEIMTDRQDCLYLGNLDAQRDWGHARDFVQGMWRILQQDSPGDYVLATGVAHSVRELAACAFKRAGVELVWQGSGADERGIDDRSGRVLVRVDPSRFRPSDVDLLVGDAQRAHDVLGWKPSISFEQMINEMMDADLEAAKAR